MIIKKITMGYVIQKFDTCLKNKENPNGVCVDQEFFPEFIAGNEKDLVAEVEDELGERLLTIKPEQIVFPFDMIQPRKINAKI